MKEKTMRRHYLREATVMLFVARLAVRFIPPARLFACHPPPSRIRQASMAGRSGQMRQTTTAEVRLDHGKAAGSGLTGEQSGEFGCGGTSRGGRSGPNGRESGECRF